MRRRTAHSHKTHVLRGTTAQNLLTLSLKRRGNTDMKRFRLLWLILFGLTATVLRAAWTPETLPMVQLADARR